MTGGRIMKIHNNYLPQVQKKHCLLMGKYLRLDWMPVLIYKQHDIYQIYNKHTMVAKSVGTHSTISALFCLLPPPLPILC